jgi:MFS family permease
VSLYAMPLAAGGALYGVTTYYGPINLTAAHGWSAGMADLMFAIWLAVGTISSYYFGSISARLGRKRVVTVGYIGSVVGLVALFLTSEWYLIAPALVVFGGVMFLTYPALFAMVSDVTSSEERGTAFGMVFAFQLGGGSAVVYLCGLIADRYDDPSYAFPVTAAFALASLAMFAFSKNGSR